MAPRRKWSRLAVGCAIAIILTASGLYHWLVYVPHQDQPHSLTVLDRLFDVAVAGGIVSAGFLIGLHGLDWLRVRTYFGRTETVALATGLGLGVLSLTVLGLGMLHLYYPVTFAVLLLATPLLFARERQWVLDLTREAALTLRHLPARRGRSLFDTIAIGLCAVLSVSVILLTLARDLTMPSFWTGYDTYQYHWAVPLLLLRSHSMRAFPGWAHANLPFNSEMLNLIALGLDAPQAATMVQDAFGVLSLFLVYALVRRYVGVTAAWLSVLVLSTVPLMIVYSSQSFVETALVFYGIASAVIMSAWLLNVMQPRQQRTRLLILAGIFVGLDIGVKYTAVEFLPGLAVLFLFGLTVIAWRGWRGQDRRGVPRKCVMSVAAFTVSTALALAPWLFKNWLLLGNPVYPALANIFGAPAWDGARSQTLTTTFASFGPHAGKVTALHLYALDMFFHPWRYGEGIGFPAGFAAFGVVIALVYFWLAIRLGWWRRRTKEQSQALILGALAVVTTLSFGVWSVSGALVERYALPPIMLANLLGAMFIGWMLSRVPRRLEAVSWLLLTLVLGISVFQAWGSLLNDAYTDSPSRNPLPLLLGQVSEQSAMRSRVIYGMPREFWQMTDYVNQRVPNDGKLLMLGRGSGYFFTDREYVADSGGDWVPYLVSEGRTSGGMLNLLHAEGFDYVVYDATLMRWLTERYGNSVLGGYLPAYLSFQQHDLLLIARWGAISLYRVPPAASTTSRRPASPAAALPLHCV